MRVPSLLPEVLGGLDTSVFTGNGFRSHISALHCTFCKGLFWPQGSQHRLGRPQAGTPRCEITASEAKKRQSGI